MLSPEMQSSFIKLKFASTPKEEKNFFCPFLGDNPSPLFFLLCYLISSERLNVISEFYFTCYRGAGGKKKKVLHKLCTLK